MIEWFSAVTTKCAPAAASSTVAVSSGLITGTLMTDTDTPHAPSAREAASAAASIIPLANSATSVPATTTDARPSRSTWERFKLMRERIEAMKEIWTNSKAEYHGDMVNFDEIMAWPKPVQKPHPPILVGGAWPQAARRAVRYGDGWCPIGGRPGSSPLDMLEQFRNMARDAGRDPQALPMTLFNPDEDAGELARYRDMGVARVVVMSSSTPPTRSCRSSTAGPG